MGRRTGRAELDEHAEGVHSAEIDVDLERSARNRERIMAHIREKLSVLPAQVAIGQPISHRLDHLLSGVRAQIALKIFGDDTDTLRGLAESLRQNLAPVRGLVDLTVEKQVLIPQITIRLDHERAAQAGLSPGQAIRILQALTDGARSIRAARKVLGPDAIVGAFCGVTRHEGMNAGEAGADYVAFGPVGATLLGAATLADRDLFGWWSEMIEVPVVAEGGLTPALVADLAPVTDFFGIGPEIWGADDPLAALGSLLAALG